ncbi:hypothetical protein [Rhizobium skierniewicense]|uniref:hypothetical protein n=1 Tax=Rhizobium skierniewicense TaxID=984260 RepID=UPI001F1B5F36|nr:hypothetical protein [Rhizobium skierniewicense]
MHNTHQNAECSTEWPPLKKALWDVVTSAKVNGKEYIVARDLTDKLFEAVLCAATTKGETLELQDRVQPWMMACFGPEISADRLERGDRLLEEVFELLQSGDYPRERIRALEDYTFSRQKGEAAQEVGGVMITLAAYCLAHGLNMHEAGETELTRIWTKVEKIRAKQAAKPTGSALPVAVACEHGKLDCEQCAECRKGGGV